MDQLVFYILVAMLLGLIGVVVMLVYGYMHLHEQVLLLTKQNGALKNSENVRAEEILADAHAKALIIIDQAQTKAAALLKESQTFDQHSADVMQGKLSEATSLHAEELKKASSELLSTYKEALEKIKSEDIQQASSLSKNLNDITTQQLSEFKNVLAKETIASEKMVEQKVDKEYLAIEAEIHAYREQKLKEVDSQILQIIQSVTEVVLQKQLSSTDQEQLVFEALNKLKNTRERN